MKMLLGNLCRFIKNPSWFYIIVIALFLYAIGCYGKVLSIYVPTFHMDGAFQTASGLFRLWRGELPGRDFYPYLGIGPIGLIYPVFLLAGAHLSASVFAAFVTVYAANILSIALIIHLIFKPTRFLVSLLSACALFSIPLLLIIPGSPLAGYIPLPYWLEPILFPGNSLRPLRGFIAYAAMGALYFFIFPEKNIRRKYVYYGITLAITSLWSNDYAFLTMGALFLLALGSFIKDSETHFLKTTAYLILFSIVSVVLAQSLVTGGHPLKLATYNFVDVARDQWWYFGSWAVLDRVFSPQELVKLLPLIQYQYADYILATSCVAIFIVKRLRLELLLVFVSGVLTLTGGLVACIGGHISTQYADGFIFWSKLVFVLFSLRLLMWFVFVLFDKKGKSVFLFINVILCTLIVTALFYYASKHHTLMETLAKNDIRNTYVPELGGYVGEEWKYYINYIKVNHDKTAIEEYFGIWSAFLKKPSIWPVDSAIHALGSVRQTAEKALREKADIVITSNRKTASIEWLAWNQSVNYWFYKTLFESYTPAFYSPTTIVWEKDKPRQPGKAIACQIAESKDRILLDAPAVGYYEVKLKTKMDKLSKSRSLIMFETNMNFAILEDGELPISPYSSEHTLPIYVSHKENREFAFKVRPADAGRVSIESCSAREIPFKNKHVLLMSEGVDNIYDEHANDGSMYGDINFWDRGISTKKAGFFLFKDKKAVADYTMGRVIELPSGEKRSITGVVDGMSAYLEVYLDGPTLDADEVGVPTKFKLLNDDKAGSLAMAIGDRIYFSEDLRWKNGISLIGPTFIQPNTEKNRRLYVTGKRLQIPNTTERVVTGATEMGVYLSIGYSGDLLDSAVVGLPSKFKVLDEEAPTQPLLGQSNQTAHDRSTSLTSKLHTAKANAIKDDFFLTNNTWINGVGFYEAAFFVKNTEDNRQLFVVGKRVKIPNTEDREIIKVLPNGPYIEVYVSGEPMDGSRVGLPSGFKVISNK